MRLCLYQGPSPAGDAGAGFAAVDLALAAAKAAGADMALMPELFLPGYNHEPMDADPAWPERLAAAARAHGVALAIGLAERDESGALRNAAHAFGPDGAPLARYDKIQLWGEREAGHFTAGARIVAFDFAGRRLGFAICYDIEFPEIVRAHAEAGVDLILVPTGNPAPFENVSDLTVPALALVNAVAIAYANYCGAERGATYCGKSLVVGPDGVVLASAGPGPALLIVDVPARGDPSLAPLSTQAEDRTFGR